MKYKSHLFLVFSMMVAVSCNTADDNRAEKESSSQEETEESRVVQNGDDVMVFPSTEEQKKMTDMSEMEQSQHIESIVANTPTEKREQTTEFNAAGCAAKRCFAYNPYTGNYGAISPYGWVAGNKSGYCGAYWGTGAKCGGY